jgi:mono/diheme cytochrome c family protein
MKKLAVASALFLFIVGISAFRKNAAEEATYIPPSKQRTGDPAKGYQYLITGDFLRSGFPYEYFTMMRGKDQRNLLHREGKNATVDVGYNVIESSEGVSLVIPTCLQCHAQVFNDTVIVGLGNNYMDFTEEPDLKKVNMGISLMKTTAPKKYKASSAFFASYKAVTPHIVTEVRGMNSADKLAAILAAHRNPQTLAWSDTPMVPIPNISVPTDVPAWWMLKKKNAMFYTALGRGDFARFLMTSNMLTVADTNEAKEVDSHFGDVLAYIMSIEPPKYPRGVDAKVAAKGKMIFNDKCSKCHGTYGEGGQYPNLLIAGDVVETDPLLYKAAKQYPMFEEWFNKSWFAQGPNGGHVVLSDGYVAPPLDGVWITAPYFHNGSVPTIEAVLNSKLRPKYWTRNFSKPEYDYEHLGWKYEAADKPDGKKYYNTTLEGYGNYGHYFGDVLTDEERKAVIEYVKTL